MGGNAGRLSLRLNLLIWKALSGSNVSDSASAGSRVDPVAGRNAACSYSGAGYLKSRECCATFRKCSKREGVQTGLFFKQL